MRITKRQLRRIVESSYEEIARIRDSGDYEWQDMEYEVVDLMGSMQSIPAEDAIQIMYDALDAPNRSDEGFWQMMLSNGGNLYQALDGLKKTADEEYDPDIPVHEGRITTKVSKRQLRRIIKEEKARLNELGISRHERDSRLDDPDDLTLGVEAYEKIVNHLHAMNDIIENDNNRGGGSIDHYSDEVNQIKALLPWAQDMLAYWREG